MTTNENRDMRLKLLPESIILKDGIRYVVPEPGIIINIIEGITLRASPNSSEEMVLLKDRNIPKTGVDVIRKDRGVIINTCIQLKKYSTSDIITFEKDEIFCLTNESKVEIPKGSVLYINKLYFVKDDDLPMYVICPNYLCHRCNHQCQFISRSITTITMY